MHSVHPFSWKTKAQDPQLVNKRPQLHQFLDLTMSITATKTSARSHGIKSWLFLSCRVVICAPCLVIFMKNCGMKTSIGEQTATVASVFDLTMTITAKQSSACSPRNKLFVGFVLQNCDLCPLFGHFYEKQRHKALNW